MNEIVFDKIKSIKKIGKRKTIDITTDGNHLFFANNILSHNSGWDTSEISLGNVSESADTAATSDFCASLYQLEGDREANKLCSTILKNRFGGQVGKHLEYFVDYSSLRIKNSDDTLSEQEEGVTADIINSLGMSNL